jgi:hypothetical protein
VMDAVLDWISLVASSVFVSAVLAWVWARNRGWFGYINSTVCVWAGISAIPPVDLAHFLASLIALAPFALLPVLFLVPMVVKGVPARSIVIVSTVASIFALPLTFCCSLYASCYVLHDCP